MATDYNGFNTRPWRMRLSFYYRQRHTKSKNQYRRRFAKQAEAHEAERSSWEGSVGRSDDIADGIADHMRQLRSDGLL